MKKQTPNGLEASIVTSQITESADRLPTQTMSENNILPAVINSTDVNAALESITKLEKAFKRRRSPQPYFETGHAVNVNNFQIEISYVTGFGARYNPSNPLLKLANLETVYDDASRILNEVTSTFNAYKMALDQRQSYFFTLHILATQIMAELKASGASKKCIKKAESYNNKLQGKRVKAIINDMQKTASASRLSFTQRMQNFEGLIGVCNDEPLYLPSEDNLKIVTLNDLLAKMQSSNKSAIEANTKVSNARLNRNATLYDNNKGLVDIAMSVKEYVKAVYGFKSPEFKQISALSFKKIKKL